MLDNTYTGVYYSLTNQQQTKEIENETYRRRTARDDAIKCTRNTKASLERKQKDGFLFETYNKARLYAMALKELNGKLRKLTY